MEGVLRERRNILYIDVLFKSAKHNSHTTHCIGYVTKNKELIDS